MMVIGLLAGIALALFVSVDLRVPQPETKAALVAVQGLVPAEAAGQNNISGTADSNFLAVYFNKRCRTERQAADPEHETQALQRLVALPLAMLQILRGEH
jgi:hypothetical protein